MVSFVGLDWSGIPGKPVEVGEFYLCCSIGVPDIDEVDNYFAEWRRHFGVARGFEFHGARTTPEVVQTAIQYAIDTSIVSVVWFDKTVIGIELGESIFDKPAILPPIMAYLALIPLLESFSIRRIWCDEDIKSKERQKTFNTLIKQTARERLDNSKLVGVSPDVKHYPSDKSNMIQFADLIAYGVQRDLRGLPDAPERRRVLRKLENKPGNTIREIKGDDLRPYL